MEDKLYGIDRVEAATGINIPSSRPGADYSHLTPSRDAVPPGMDYGEIRKTYGSIADANAFRQSYIANVKEGMSGAGLETRGPGSFLRRV